MKNLTQLVLILALVALSVRGADFNVTAPGFSYSVNGVGPNPVITLVRGFTYSLSVTTGTSHPFVISPTNGLSTNNLSSGIITFAVPTNAANYTYRCGIHGFGGSIITTPLQIARLVPSPPPLSPPTLLLRSNAGSNATVLPEFKTNVTSSTWSPLTILSNRFFNGTNEVFCGRPSGTNLFIRIQAQKP